MNETLYDRLVEICRDGGIENPRPGDIARIINRSSGRPRQIKDAGGSARLGADSIQLLVAKGYSPKWVQEGKKPKFLNEVSPKKPQEQTIDDLIGLSTPRSRKALESIAEAHNAGKLTEADLELLEAIAKRFQGR